MPRLIASIIRHGDYHQLPDAPSAHQPFPLNEKGREQAQQAAVVLRQILDKHGWQLSSQVDSSQLLRGWQTADIVIDGLKDRFDHQPEHFAFEALAERGLGSAANLTTMQIEQILSQDPRFDAPPADWKSNSHYQLPLQGAESLLQAGKRVAQHMQTRMQALASDIQQDTLKLFVGHGAAFRHAAYHLGILEFEQIKQLSMYHAQPVYLEYQQNGEWRHIDGQWKVRAKVSEFKD